MANEVGITVTGKDVSGSQVLDNVSTKAVRSKASIEGIATATDELDTTAAGATSSIGALSSGFELIGQTGAVEYMGQAALATDFLAGIGEGATLVLSKFGGTFAGLKDGVKGYIKDMKDGNTTTGNFVKGVAAGTLAVVAFGVAAQAASAAFGKELNPNVEELTFDLKDLAYGNKQGAEATRLFGEEWEHLSYDLGTLGSGALDKTGNAIAGFIEKSTGLGDVFDESLTKAKDRIGALDEALAKLVAQGDTDAARDAFQRLATQAEEAGITLDELEAGLPKYAAAQSKAARATETTTDATVDQNVALNDLDDAIRAQTDPLFNLIDKQKDLKEAQENSTKAIKENGRNSPQARQALLDLAKATLGAASAAADVAGTFNGRLSPALRNTLKSAGMTEDEIADLERQFDKARKAGDKFAKNYNANAIVTWKQRGNSNGFSGGDFSSGGRFLERAAGGPAHGLTLVGENGPELVDMGDGAHVYPGTAYGGSGGGMGGVMQIELVGSSDPLMNAIIQQLRFRVSREAAGSAQQLLGVPGRATA